MFDNALNTLISNFRNVFHYSSESAILKIWYKIWQKIYTATFTLKTKPQLHDIYRFIERKRHVWLWKYISEDFLEHVLFLGEGIYLICLMEQRI